jgi:hypothetical protein
MRLLDSCNKYHTRARTHTHIHNTIPQVNMIVGYWIYYDNNYHIKISQVKQL